MADFLTDDEMAALEKTAAPEGESADFISDEEMEKLSVAEQPEKEFGPTADGKMRNFGDVDWLGAIKHEFTKEPDPSARAFLANPAVGAAGPIGPAAAAKGVKGVVSAAERFATSPLPGKIQKATNLAGMAKSAVGKIGDFMGKALPEGRLKKVLDVGSGAAARKVMYGNPLSAPIQLISDTAGITRGAQNVVAKGLDGLRKLPPGAKSADGLLAAPLAISQYSKFGKGTENPSPATAGAASEMEAVDAAQAPISPETQEDTTPLSDPRLDNPTLTKKLSRRQLNALSGTPYANTLAQAAQKGGDSVETVHFLLAQDDPKYQALLKREEEKAR